MRESLVGHRCGQVHVDLFWHHNFSFVHHLCRFSKPLVLKYVIDTVNEWRSSDCPVTPPGRTDQVIGDFNVTSLRVVTG